MKSYVCGVIGAVGSGLAFLFGGWDSAILTLLIFMGIDYVLGFLLAAVFKKSKHSESGALESRAGWKGLVKKGVTLLMVVVANLLDMQLHTDYIRTGVCIAFMTNELISIIENAALMGVPVPGIITNAIDLLKKGSDKK